MSKNSYSNEILLDVVTITRDSLGKLNGLEREMELEKINLALTELSKLGRFLLTELHRRGKVYSDV